MTDRTITVAGIAFFGLAAVPTRSAMASLPIESLEYVSVAVSTSKAGVAYGPRVSCPFDRSCDVVRRGVGVVWREALREGACRAVTLAKGVYSVWVKVSDSPEVPVRKAGVLQVV